MNRRGSVGSVGAVAFGALGAGATGGTGGGPLGGPDGGPPGGPDGGPPAGRAGCCGGGPDGGPEAGVTWRGGGGGGVLVAAGGAGRTGRGRMTVCSTPPGSGSVSGSGRYVAAVGGPGSRCRLGPVVGLLGLRGGEGVELLRGVEAVAGVVAGGAVTATWGSSSRPGGFRASPTPSPNPRDVTRGRGNWSAPAAYGAGISSSLHRRSSPHRHSAQPVQRRLDRPVEGRVGVVHRPQPSHRHLGVHGGRPAARSPRRRTAPRRSRPPAPRGRRPRPP